jgi:hypothetical protein
MLLGATLATQPAQAAFHLWSLQEIYSDSSGNLQFIELVDHSGGQNFVGGTTLSVANIGNTITHNFTFPSNLPTDSFNHTMLLGTAGLAAAGGPTPDYIIPNNFLFTAGGAISFFQASGSYTALPTDGSLARVWGDGNAVNSPQNFAGQMGVVVVPEPMAGSFLALGVLTCCATLRRRSLS